MNTKGQLSALPGNLLLMFIVITFLVALLPGMMEIISGAQSSESLNCAGYSNADNPALNYNSTKPTSTIACLAIKLYIPYIVLGVLIGVVGYIFWPQQQTQQYSGGYGGY